MDTLNVASANLYSRPSGLLYTTHFHTLPQGTEIQCVLVQQEPDRHSTRAPLTIVGCQIQPLGSLQGVSLFTRHVMTLVKIHAQKYPSQTSLQLYCRVSMTVLSLFTLMTVNSITVAKREPSRSC